MKPVVHVSRFSFDETVTRLSIAIARSGATISCKLDQSGAARAVGLSLRSTTLFIFGDLQVGTQLMESSPLSGLDFPLKLLVWQDADVVNVAYTSVQNFAKSWGLNATAGLLTALDDQVQQIVGSIAFNAAQKRIEQQ